MNLKNKQNVSNMKLQTILVIYFFLFFLKFIWENVSKFNCSRQKINIIKLMQMKFFSKIRFITKCVFSILHKPHGVILYKPIKKKIQTYIRDNKILEWKHVDPKEFLLLCVRSYFFLNLITRIFWVVCNLTKTIRNRRSKIWVLTLFMFLLLNCSFILVLGPEIYKTNL